jgi:hypothetical protein
MMELCSDIRNADVVVTAVQMRKRLERHLDWELAVRPNFFADRIHRERVCWHRRRKQ